MTPVLVEKEEIWTLDPRDATHRGKITRRHGQKVCGWEPRRAASGATKPVDTLILDF